MKKYKETTVVCWRLQRIGSQTTLICKSLWIPKTVCKLALYFERACKHLSYPFKSPMAGLEYG